MRMVLEFDLATWSDARSIAYVDWCVNSAKKLLALKIANIIVEMHMNLLE
jgi:hypothetical protein